MSVTLRLYDGDGAYKTHLPLKHGNAKIQETLNVEGSGALNYPANGKGAADLMALTGGDMVALHLDGLEVFRFLVEDDEDDEADEAGPAREVKVGGPGTLALLARGIVLPKGGIGTVPAEWGFRDATPGAIMLALLGTMKGLGYLTQVQTSFTATHDTNGVAWEKIIDITYDAGKDLLVVAKDLAAQKTCDLRMVGLTLNMWNPGTELATDRPNVYVRRVHATKAPRKRSVRDLRTDFLVVGDGGVNLRVQDDAARARYGASIGYVGQGNTTRDATLRRIGADTLTENARPTRGYEMSLRLAHRTCPQPYRDFYVGDKIRTDYAPGEVGGYEPMRVRSIATTINAAGAVDASLELNDRFLEAILDLRKRINGIAHGTISEASAPPPSKPPVSDTTIPLPPASLTVNPTIRVNPEGNVEVVAEVAWPEATRNTDGTLIDDFYEYRVAYRLLDRSEKYSGWVSTTGLSMMIGPLPQGERFQAYIVTVDANRHISAEGSSGVLTLPVDDGPPPTPSAPVPSAHLGGVRVEYDLLTEVGAPMPPDYRYSELHASQVSGFTAGAATVVETLYGRVAWLPDVEYGVPLYLRLVAVDAMGNVSLPSAQAQVTPRALVSAEIGVGEIIGDLIGDDAVTGRHIADGSITAQKVSFEFGGAQVFYGAAPPVPGGVNVGDLWVRSTDNRLHRWDGAAWVEIVDQGVAAALDAAFTAQAVADGKVDTFYSPDQPAAAADGDLWVDTGDENRLYRYLASRGPESARNHVWNPSVEVDAAGWTPGETATTAARSTVEKAHGDASVAVGSGTAGAVTVAVPMAGVVTGGRLYTFAVSALAPLPVPVTAEVGWRDAAGAVVGPLTVPLGDAGAGAFTRISAGVTAPGDAATGHVTLSVPVDAGLPVHFDAAVFMPGVSPDYFDGGFGDGEWDGAAGSSTSTYSPRWVEIRDEGIAAAIAAAGDAAAIADGKITTFVSGTAPTAQSIGDLWIHTGQANTLYRWSGTVWEEVRDEGIAQAIAEAAAAQRAADEARAEASAALASAVVAQSTADTKITTYYQPDPPVGADSGDLWIDTDGGNQLHRFNGAEWVAVQDAAIQGALVAAGDAQATADGKIVTFAQPDPPTATAVGDMWVDTDAGNLLHRWTAPLGLGTRVNLSTNPAGPYSAGGWTSYVSVVDGATIGPGATPRVVDGRTFDMVRVASTGTTTRTGVRTLNQHSIPGGTRVTVAADIWVDAGHPIDQWFWLFRDDPNNDSVVNVEGLPLFTPLKGQWQRVTATATVKAGRNLTGIYLTSKDHTAAIPAGVGQETTRWTITTDGTTDFFDGYSPAASWDGAPHASTSTYAPAWVPHRDTAIAAASASAADAIAAAQAAQTAADAAQATADGAIRTYYQANPPDPAVEDIGIGDLWFDTDNDQAYRWTGAEWVLIQDNAIASALAAAQNAQTTADGKIVSFYSPTAPSGGAVGDLWFDTDDGNSLHWWDGAVWVRAVDAGIAQALADAAAAQVAADAATTTYYQAAAPTGAIAGDLWVDSDDNRLYRWSGSVWVDMQDTSIGEALAGAANAQAVADGKIVTFAQPDPPTAAAVGDIWVETDNGNRLYRWDGSSWVPVPVGTGGLADGAVTPQKIAYLDANQITVGTLDAERIAAGSVTTEKLTVGAVSDSMARNGGFEELTGGIPTGWVLDSGGVFAGATYAVDGVSARQGQRCLRMRGATGAPARTYSGDTTPATEGEWYYASAWLAGTAGTGTVTLYWYGDGDGYLATSTGDAVTLTTTYTKMSVAAKGPVGARGVRVAVVANSSAGGTDVFVDDVDLRRATGTAQLLNASITSAKIAELAVQDQHVANLNAGKITAGLIDADRVRLGSLGASKLAIGTGVNLIPDPAFDDPGRRVERDGFKSDPTRVIWTADGIAGNTTYCARWVHPTPGTGLLINESMYLIDRGKAGFPITTGNRLYGSMNVYRTATVGQGTLELRVVVRHQDGSLSYHQLAAATLSNTGGAVFRPVAGLAVMPVTAVEAWPYISSYSHEGGAWTVDDVQVQHALTGASETGEMFEASPQGVRLLSSEGTPVVVMTSTPPSYFSIAQEGPRGPVTVGSWDQDGFMSVSGLSTTEDPTVAGLPLVGTYADHEQFYSESNIDVGILSSFPRGPVAFGQTEFDRSTTSEVALFEVEFEAKGGRMYEVVVPSYALRRSVTGGSGGIHVRYTDNGAEPDFASFLLGVGYATWAATSAGSVQFNRFLRCNPAGKAAGGELNPGTQRLLVTLWTNGGTIYTYSSSPHPLQMLVSDVGLDIPRTHTFPSGGGGTSVAKKSYVSTWAASWSGSYDGGNALESSRGNDINQGYYDGGSGNRRSLAGFTANAVKGETGKTITGALAGATISRVRVYLYYEHWYDGTGGTAVIGYHGNTARPSTFSGSTDRVRSTKWPRGAGRWVTLSSTVVPFSYWASGAARGVTIGPGPNTSRTYYGRAKGAGQTYRPLVEITYTR